MRWYAVLVFSFWLTPCYLIGSSFIYLIQFSHSVMTDSLWPHELQHARPPCPLPTPRAYTNLCPLSGWCHPTISSSVVPFSSRPQSGSFPMSRLFASHWRTLTTTRFNQSQPDSSVPVLCQPLDHPPSLTPVSPPGPSLVQALWLSFPLHNPIYMLPWRSSTLFLFAWPSTQ